MGDMGIGARCGRCEAPAIGGFGHVRRREGTKAGDGIRNVQWPRIATGNPTTSAGCSAPGRRLPPREQFAETAYWNPSVVTDKDGKATVKFKAPMGLSEYRFSAKGVTGSDTLVGQSLRRR